MFWSELVTGPDSGGGGQGIEIIEFKQTGCGLVMIAADKNFAQGARAIDDFVGRGAVADDIAEVGYEVVGGSPGQAGLQGFEVGMNVAKQQYAQ